MKARIYLLVIVFAAGLVTAGAQETKTNAVPGTGEVAAPPPVLVPSTSAPAAAKEAKPPSGATLTPASPVPIAPKTTASPRMSSAESTGTGHKEVLTNPPPPAATAAEEVKPPDEGALTPTSAVPVEAEVSNAPPGAGTPPPESSGIDRKTALLIGGAILLVAGGLAGLMWRRANAASHGSLISSALNLVKYDEKTEDKAGEEGEAGTEVTRKPVPEAKPEEKKFPPPMN